MAKLVLVFVALATVAFAGTIPNPKWRIVGGSEANEDQFNYIISLRKHGNHICGGSIIDKRTIVTAAHCVNGMNAKDLSVYTGTTLLDAGGSRYDVSKIVVHEKYNSVFINNDIAIVKVSTDIFFNEFVQPIQLEEEMYDEMRDAILAGWGTTSYPGSTPNELQFISLKTISNEECVRKHGTKGFLVTDNQLCTLTVKNEGACHGDSGGPLASHGRLIGVVSWGVPCGKGSPDVYTRVSSYINWINQNM